MEFKNKKNKGWILEEIEKKKDECLDANQFGGENPEDVEKHQEEVNKEINKRFDAVKKVEKKIIGQDFEEHAKPHKVEVYYVGRKDLGEAIGKLKEQNITYTVKRSPKEGFRYVVEYFSDEHKKDEPLLEKIDLEEEEAKEGFISGAKELSHDELANLEKSLWDKLDELKIHPSDGTFSNSSNRLADLDLIMVINGDWKHDHLSAENAVEEWCKDNGYVIIKHTSEEIGDSDRDDYEAEHKWFLVKDTDGKMTDTVNTLHQMFTPAEETESLNESITFEVNDDGDLVAKSKDNYLIIGSEEDKDLSDAEKKERMMRVLKDFKNDDTMKSEYDYWMSVLNTNESLNEVLDDEELPDAIPDEAIVVSTEPGGDVATVVEEPSEEVKKAGLYNALSAELRDTLQDIENLKSLTVTFVEEGREDLIDDLNAIIDERIIHSGMLQDLMSRVEGKVEAEETNNEEPKPDNNEAEIIEVESLNEDVVKREYSDEEIERAKKFQALSLRQEGRRKAAKEVEQMSNSEFIAEFLDALGSEGLDELIDMSKNESLKEEADVKLCAVYSDKDDGPTMEEINKALEEIGSKIENVEEQGEGNYSVYFKASKDNLRKAIDKLDMPHDDDLSDWIVSESLKEAKEETIHLDKYEIDDTDSAEQKEDAKIMPYGEVTKKQWEDFLSKAKWPYWLAWENLKNEVEHKE